MLKRIKASVPIALRREAVSQLYSLGIFLKDIAKLLQISFSTVTNDLAALGGMKKVGSFRPKGREKAFPFVLEFYAKLVSEVGHGRKREPLEVMLRNALSKWLHEEEILFFVSGVRAALDYLSIPEHPPQLERYVQFLRRALFIFFRVEVPVWYWFDDSLERSSLGPAREAWEGYLARIADGGLPVPHELCEAFLHYYVGKRRADIAPTWTDETVAIIEEQLTKLNGEKPYGDVLRLRNGLGKESGKELTREAIAEILGMSSRERVRQVEAVARRRIASEPYRKVLKPLMPYEHDRSWRKRLSEIQTDPAP
ncbi:MAG: hypothetical protein HY459_00775 [Parcubacteria group bacterium]|nr:hypothetical protein [Parcubacteria group bacterium]